MNIAELYHELDDQEIANLVTVLNGYISEYETIEHDQVVEWARKLLADLQAAAGE